MFDFRMLGKHCQFSPANCQRLKQTSLSIKCTDPQLCVVNDTKKLGELNQLASQSCKTEQDKTLDTYFTCIREQSADHCACPSRK